MTDQNYLRGVQITDASGKVYPDQASITDSTNAIATSQIAIPQAECETVYATERHGQPCGAAHPMID